MWRQEPGDWQICHTNQYLDEVHKLVLPRRQTLLQWRHNKRVGVSNHQTHDCLLNRLFKAQIKENIKVPRHRPLCGEFTGDRWVPRTKGQWCGKCFHVMTSSCFNIIKAQLATDFPPRLSMTFHLECRIRRDQFNQNNGYSTMSNDVMWIVAYRYVSYYRH